MPARKKQNINLLPKEDFERTTLGRVMKWALTTFRAIVIVVELIVILGFLSRFWLDVQVSNLTEEIEQKSALISSRASFEEEFRRAQLKLEIFDAIAAEKNTSRGLLLLVAENLPADTKLVSFKREANNLSINAATLNETSISGFINNLNEAEQFSEINITRIDAKTGEQTIEFTLDIVLAREEEAF